MLAKLIYERDKQGYSIRMIDFAGIPPKGFVFHHPDFNLEVEECNFDLPGLCLEIWVTFHENLSEDNKMKLLRISGFTERDLP